MKNSLARSKNKLLARSKKFSVFDYPQWNNGTSICEIQLFDFLRDKYTRSSWFFTQTTFSISHRFTSAAEVVTGLILKRVYESRRK